MNLPKADSPGGRLRGPRRTYQLTQVELAKRLKISQGALSDIETGATKEIMAPTLARIVEVFSVNPDWFLTGKKSPVKPEALSVDESELVAVFRELTHPHRTALLSTARALLDSQPGTPSRVSPYKKPTKV